MCLSVCLAVGLSSCLSVGGPEWSHNSVLNGWSDCLSDLHLPHQTEPRHKYINTEDRPDITMFDPNTGQNLDIDVSLAHPWSQDIIRRASKESGHAAATREEKKMKKYSEELVPGGYVSRCVPLVIEHFGRWGTKAENFLKHLSQQSAKMQKPILMLPFSCSIVEKDFVQFCKDAIPKLSLENFQNCYLIMVI